MSEAASFSNENTESKPQENILIVDDDPGIRETLSSLLESKGYRTLTAEDGLSACAILDTASVMCVLTDIMMPNMTGIELIRKIKEKDLSLPVIVITGHASIEMAIDAMKQGASDFITKPFKINQIEFIINKVKREKDLIEENRRYSDELNFYRMIDNLSGQIEDKSTQIKSLNTMSETITGLKGVRELINATIYLTKEQLRDAQVFFHPVNRETRFLKTQDGDITLDEDFLKGHHNRIECELNGTKGINTFFPLIIEGQIFGVISIKTPLIMTLDEEHKITYLLQRTAERMENVVLFQELYESILSTLYGMAKILDARDPYTSQHSTRVTSLAMMQAKYLNLDDTETDILDIASRLHDIGKVGVPDSILLKAADLTKEEFSVVKRHPDIGADILKSISIMQRETEIIRHHHEHYDGKGYPSGLKGDEIPYLSRIISLADTFDAMTTDRPYRKALSTQDAVAEIIRCKGTQFDPLLADSFIEVIKHL